MPSSSKNTPILIEAMKVEDLDPVLTIEQSVFPRPWSRELFEKALQAPHSIYDVARERNLGARRIVAYIGIERVLDEAHIVTFAVAPEHQHKGIGTELLQKMMAEARQWGARTFFLEVRASNFPAKNLYQKFGFEKVGTRKRYYRDSEEDAEVWVEGVSDLR